MALATLPPAVEIVEAFKNGELGYELRAPRHNLSEPYWANSNPIEQPAWKTVAFGKISVLRAAGTVVPGLGDFRVSDLVTKELHMLLSKIRILSLPLPTVSPVAGGAIFVSWKNGHKAVEATAYHNGEIVVEAIENLQVNEEISKSDIATMLDWLARG
jgi:hypothetical protein